MTFSSLKVDQKKVVEVIGRLKGRAESHRNSADQTNCKKKKDTHNSAYCDLMSLACDLAEAFDDPEYVFSKGAYNEAVKGPEPFVKRKLKND